MVKQAAYQKKFLAYAFGGSPSYSGRAIREVHKRLVEEKGLVDEHFDAVVENFGSTLKELGVADDLIAEAADIAESVREEVLNR